MADNRQSFAFNVAAPVQGAVEGGGGYRGSTVQGGQASGSDRSPQALGGANLSTGLGSYFDKLTQPALEREQRARFAKGMTDQMYAAAGEEIRTGSGALSKIFGPTDYEQGALFYESQSRVAKTVQEWSAQEDDLKKLPKEEVAKRWADTMNGAMTGDPFLDDAVTQDLLKQAAPALQSVAKASYKYGQERAATSMINFVADSGNTFQTQSQQFADTTAPTEEASQGWLAARQQFLNGLQKQPGQDDDSYVKGLTSAFGHLLRNGSGHAATAMIQSGFLDLIPPDQRARLEDQYEKFGHKAAGEGINAFMGEVDQLQGELSMGQLTGEQAVARHRQLNEQVRRHTGFDADYFDASDQQTVLKGVWAARKAALEKQEERDYQNQRDIANDARAAARDQAKEDRKIQMAETAWNSANPGIALAAGVVDNESMQARAYKGYLDNDFAGMQRSYKSGVISSPVKSLIQNTVMSASNTGYTPEFQNLHAKFGGMVATNPALAKEYFGPLFPNMVNYNRLLTSQTPQAAFSMAFGNDVQYAADGPQIASGKKAVTKWVASNAQPGFFSSLFGSPTLNTSGVQALSNLIGREVAQDSKFAGGDLSQDTLIKGAYTRAITNGTFEQYGRIGWSNGKPTTPLHRLMGMEQGEASHVVETLIDRKLKAAGFAEGASADEFSITRASRDGKETLIVVPIEDGVMNSQKGIVLGIDQLKAGGIAWRQEQVRAPKSTSKSGKGMLGYGGAGGDFVTENNKNGYGTRNK